MVFGERRFSGRFPSGQRDQTVNLTAQPSEVRILPSPPKDNRPDGEDRRFGLRGGNSSVGRASAFQAEGRGFEPRFPLQDDSRLSPFLDMDFIRVDFGSRGCSCRNKLYYPPRDEPPGSSFAEVAPAETKWYSYARDAAGPRSSAGRALPW